MKDTNLISLMGVVGMILILLSSFIYYESNWQNDIYIAIFGKAINILCLVWFIGLGLYSFKHIKN